MKKSLHIHTNFVSSNFDKRPQKKIDTIVIHSTHRTFSFSIKRLCDKLAKVSCHYIINLDGKIYQLIPDQARAWHAGISCWRGITCLNNNSIGIELVDTDNKRRRIKEFPKPQMGSLLVLLKLLIKKYQIPDWNIVAHSDIAPDRKDDPGENFDWQLLASHGIGHYHDIIFHKDKDARLITSKSTKSQIKEMQQALKNYGYKINITGKFDTQTHKVIIAFRRRFNPHRIKRKSFNTMDAQILSHLSKLN